MMRIKLINTPIHFQNISENKVHTTSKNAIQIIERRFLTRKSFYFLLYSEKV